MKKPFYKIQIISFMLILTLSQSAFANFPDVSSSNPHYDAILYAEKNGIIEGYQDKKFKSHYETNRAEFIKIVIGAAFDFKVTDKPSIENSLSLAGITFDDVSPGKWYNPYLRFAIQKEIISGYKDHTFRAEEKITFTEAAKVIIKSFNYQVTSDPVWYKPYVIKLAELKAIPTSITSLQAKVTRGEMVEIIYRVKAKIALKDSKTWDQLTGNIPASIPNNIAKISDTCSVFPADNAWNRDISKDPIDPNSNNYMSYILKLGGNQFLHADFGGNGAYGIPYSIVSGNQPKVAIEFTDYGDESDPGPYPIPSNARKENGSDAHVIVADKDNCKLYELYAASYMGPGWRAASGAVFDLTNNRLRPERWTSADAAGLPIFAGLIKHDEVNAGAIHHAIRFTLASTQKAYIHPATHQAGNTTDPNAPPMGLRLRLKANYDISGFSGQSRIIMEALKKYGLILADNGSNWYLTGSQDTQWNDEDLNQLKKVPGNAFEAVSSGPLIK